MNLGRLREVVRDREAWCATVHEVTKCWIQLDNWTRTTAMWGASICCNMLTSSYKIFTKCVYVCVCEKVTQSCPALCLPGSSVHRIFQARTLQWVAIYFSKGSSRSRDRTQVSHIAGRLPSETPRKPTKYTPVIKIQQENHGPRTSKGSLFSYFLHLLAYLYSNSPWIYIKRLCIQLDYTVSTVPTGPKGTLISFKRKYKVFILH